MAQAVAAPPRCLLIEDEVLIGMDLEDSLCEAGFDVQWAASTQIAFELLTGAPFDAAVLDVTVRSEPCGSIANELKRRQIPFVVHSGHRRDDGLSEFRDVPWLEKPAEARALIKALVDTMDDVGSSMSNRAEQALRVPQASSR